MTDKLDFKREYRDLYLPPKRPILLEVPGMNFLMVDGEEAPQGERYQEAVGLLYAVAFTIKMSRLSGDTPAGYRDFVVPPLEGLWEFGPEGFDPAHKGNWKWTSLLRLPDFVTPEVFAWAKERAQAKKRDSLDFSRIRFASFSEGLCVQMMHIGPYETESSSLEKMQEFMLENGLADLAFTGRRHHELYLSDPRRTAPEKLRTVLRHPVARAD